MDKYTRLLSLVALLEQSARPLTAEQISEQLGAYAGGEAGRRSFERDKADLLHMGVPLETVEVPADPSLRAYTIRYERSEVGDPGFTPAELAALRFAATTMALREDGVDAIADATDGLRKYGGLGGPAHAVTIAEIRLDGNLTTLFEAVLAGGPVGFRHSDRVRRVLPRQVAHHGGHWYLRCLDLDVGEARTYRLDRIEGRVLPDPDGGDPGVTTDGSSTTDPLGALHFRPWEYGTEEPVEVSVQLDAPAAALALAEDPDLEVLTRTEDQTELRLAVRNPEGLFTWLLSFLDRAELLEPPELRARFVERLDELVATDTEGVSR